MNRIHLHLIKFKKKKQLAKIYDRQAMSETFSNQCDQLRINYDQFHAKLLPVKFTSVYIHIRLICLSYVFLVKTCNVALFNDFFFILHGLFPDQFIYNLSNILKETTKSAD